MKIGIDIDDTITKSHSVYMKTIKYYLKANNMDYKIVNKNSNHTSEIVNWSLEESVKFWDMYGDVMLEDVPARRGVAKYIKKIREYGNEVYFITARCKEWHKDPEGMSVRWLNRNQIPYDKLLVGYKEKLEICKELGIEVFIDDMPSVLKDFEGTDIKLIMMKNRHNKGYKNDNVEICKTWRQISSKIRKLNINA